MVSVRLRDITVDDAPALAELAVRSRADLELVDPPRPADFYSPAGQLRRVERILEMVEADTARFFVILRDGDIVGDIGITGIERGWFQSAHVGYLVDRDHRRLGVATAALEAASGLAFGELGLHRLDAGVLATNLASQRVLEKGGFRRIGLAERYIFVGGSWRDNLLYELVGPDVTPADPWS